MAALLAANLYVMRHTGERLDKLEAGRDVAASERNVAPTVHGGAPGVPAASGPTGEPTDAANPPASLLSLDSFDAAWRQAGMIPRAERQCWVKHAPDRDFVHIDVAVSAAGKVSSVAPGKHRDTAAVRALTQCLEPLVRELSLPPSEPVRVQVSRR